MKEKVQHSNLCSMEKIKVLLVEDEETLSMIVKETLEGQGFEVTIANNGANGLSILQESQPDILVADIMMPEMDGFEMVRRVRRTNQALPIIFLTARSAVNDVVEGFELGANDYLRKPFSMLELIARIKALVNRSVSTKREETNSIIKIGLFNLDTTTQIFSFCNEPGERLSNRESELLRMLSVNSNQIVSSDDILMQLWGDNSPYNARSLQVFITKLRHKLSRDEGIKIINVRGIGYKMII